MRILLTGGATRNPVDAIRYLSAHATGSTAVELAYQIAALFAQQGRARTIFMLGSAEALLRLQLMDARSPGKLADTEEFFGTRDLMERMRLNVPLADVVIHSAAVGDYEMAESLAGKIPSGQASVDLRLTPTPKILDQIRTWNPTCYLVSFKAAPPSTSFGDLVNIARAQLERTGSNLVFANVIGATDQVALVEAHGHSACARAEAIAVLADLVGRHQCEVKWPIRGTP